LPEKQKVNYIDKSSRKKDSTNHGMLRTSIFASMLIVETLTLAAYPVMAQNPKDNAPATMQQSKKATKAEDDLIKSLLAKDYPTASGYKFTPTKGQTPEISKDHPINELYVLDDVTRKLEEVKRTIKITGTVSIDGSKKTDDRFYVFTDFTDGKDGMIKYYDTLNHSIITDEVPNDRYSRIVASAAFKLLKDKNDGNVGIFCVLLPDGYLARVFVDILNSSMYNTKEVREKFGTIIGNSTVTTMPDMHDYQTIDKGDGKEYKYIVELYPMVSYEINQNGEVISSIDIDKFMYNY
jgi:hypothetical protein